MDPTPKNPGESLHYFKYILPFLSLALFIVCAPSFDFISWAIRFDEKRIIEVAVLTITASLIFLSNNFSLSLQKTLHSMPALSRNTLFLIFLIGTLSSYFAPSSFYAYRELSLFFLLFICAFSCSIFTKINPPITIFIFLSTIACSAFIYAIIFYTSYIGSFIQQVPLTWPEPFSNFSSVRFLNQFQVWTLSLIALPLFLYKGLFSSRLKLLLIVINIAWWVIVFASRGRGIQLSIFISSVLTLLIYRKHAWPLTKIMALSAFAGGLVYLFLFDYLQASYQDRGLDISNLFADDARIRLWSSALNMASENPLLGVGPGHYAWYPNDIAAHPHNALIQLMAEWGIPVTILCILLALSGLTAWCKQFYRLETIICDNRKKHLWIALFSSTTTGMLYSMVSGVIVMPLGQIMFAAVTGIMLGLYTFTEPDIKKLKPTKPILLRLTLAGFTIFLLFSVTPDIITRINDPFPPYNDAPVNTLGPRFWQEGAIHH